MLTAHAGKSATLFGSLPWVAEIARAVADATATETWEL